MPSFTKGGNPRTPFGKNVYLRSTRGCQFESYTCAMDTVPLTIIDGTPQRILQPGTVMAKITSGPDAGKVGPFQAGGGTAEVQTLTSTATTGGTFTITITNPQSGITRTTPPIAYNATAATIQAALIALDNVDPGDVVCAGGPLNTTPVTITYSGEYQGNPAQVVLDTTLIVGTSLVASTTTGGVAGATDGRQTLTNIVGINDTFLPWQLLEHDENISVLYVGTVVQGWCFELNAAGTPIAVQNATAAAMYAQKGMDVLFR